MSLIPVTLGGGQPEQSFGSVRGFMVLGPSIGASFTVNQHGSYSISMERYSFGADKDGLYPSVSFVPGASVPLQLIIDIASDSDGGIDIAPGAQFNQEGDVVPAVGSTTVVGVTCAPTLFKAPGGKLIIPSSDASGNTNTNVVNTVAVTGSGIVGAGPVLTQQLAANNFTQATVATSGANQNATPPAGTGFCYGFYVINQGTVAADFVSVADSSAHLTANQLLAIVPFQSTSPIIPYAYTNGTGTIFVNGVAAFNVTVVALWR